MEREDSRFRAKAKRTLPAVFLKHSVQRRDGSSKGGGGGVSNIALVCLLSINAGLKCIEA